jgi:dienelactone hydrolase
VLRAAKKLPYVDLSRGLVAGQSFGGVSSLALSTLAVPGMLGAVNFSGGSGGNPVARPGDPCSKGRLRRVIGKYGEQSTVPTLWFYSLNDLYWGDKLPRLWHRSFVEAGGRARFVQLPASGQDGHGVFTQNPESWKPGFKRFVGRLGF